MTEIKPDPATLTADFAAQSSRMSYKWLVWIYIRRWNEADSTKLKYNILFRARDLASLQKTAV